MQDFEAYKWGGDEYVTQRQPGYTPPEDWIEDLIESQRDGNATAVDRYKIYRPPEVMDGGELFTAFSAGFVDAFYEFQGRE